MKTPSVSVVIPLYNARDVIKATLETVLAQTWKDYEIVVVDDGSTDGSAAIVRTYTPGVRYIRQENAGVAAARNRGIAASSGRYIALLDHDDLWHPTKLQQQVRLLEQRGDVGMVITDVAHVDRFGAPMGGDRERVQSERPVRQAVRSRLRADAVVGHDQENGVRCGRRI